MHNRSRAAFSTIVYWLSSLRLYDDNDDVSSSRKVLSGRLSLPRHDNALSLSGYRDRDNPFGYRQQPRLPSRTGKSSRRQVKGPSKQRLSATLSRRFLDAKASTLEVIFTLTVRSARALRPVHAPMQIFADATLSRFVTVCSGNTCPSLQRLPR